MLYNDINFDKHIYRNWQQTEYCISGYAQDVEMFTFSWILCLHNLFCQMKVFKHTNHACLKIVCPNFAKKQTNSDQITTYTVHFLCKFFIPILACFKNPKATNTCSILRKLCSNKFPLPWTCWSKQPDHDLRTNIDFLPHLYQYTPGVNYHPEIYTLISLSLSKARKLCQSKCHE